MRKFIHEITEDDVGSCIIEKVCQLCNHKRVINVSNLMGPVLKIDVGKRIYEVSNNADDSTVLQVENDEQLKARLERDLKRAEWRHV